MSFRRAAKTDSNQPEIVEAFRKLGCSVLIISQLKHCCDLMVANGQTAAVEIKDGTLPPSKRMLTEGECEFRKGWKGMYFIVESIDDAVRVAAELRL